MTNNKLSLVNTIYLCLLVLSTIFIIKIYNKTSYLKKRVTYLNDQVSLLGDKLSNDNQQIAINVQKQMLLTPSQEELVKYLKVYSAYDQNGALELIRHGKANDGGYVVSTKALNAAEVLMGYGIATDNSFEDQFSIIYNKPSYGFDCGIDQINSESKLFTFVKECIASDAFLYDGSATNNQISSFEQQLNKLNLKDKKIFIKMDIEGAEYDAFPEIINNKANITGIALEIHFDDIEKNKKALSLLKQLEKDFVLIHVHGNNCCVNTGFLTSSSVGVIPNVIELSYINKSLVMRYVLSVDQSHPQKIDQPNILGWPDANFKIIY